MARLTELLVSEGLLSADQAVRLDDYCRRTGVLVVAAALDLDLVSEVAMEAFLCRRHGLRSVALAEQPLDPDAVRLVPVAFASRRDVVPVRREGRRLTVAVADPSDVGTLDQVAFMTGLDVRAVIGVRSQIRQAIARVYRVTAA